MYSICLYDTTFVFVIDQQLSSLNSSSYIFLDTVALSLECDITNISHSIGIFKANSLELDHNFYSLITFILKVTPIAPNISCLMFA